MRLLVVLGLLSLTSALAVPALAQDTCPADLVCRTGEDGVLRTYRRGVRHRTDEGLIIAGASMLGGMWLLNIPISGGIALSLASDSAARSGDYFGWSFVPLVGPIVQMFQVGAQHQVIPILAVVEAVEVIGLIMAAVGTAGSDVQVLEPVSVSVVPWASPDGAGVVAAGSF